MNTNVNEAVSVSVKHGDKEYPVHIGSGLLSRAGLFKEVLRGRRQVAIVTNDVVAPLYLDQVQQALADCCDAVPLHVVPDGEVNKSFLQLERTLDFLMASRQNRTTTLIALGGGVIGDLTGFAAAIYQRGVDFIQVPTTLLAQVDSSVGGKTAINHASGKNMIGAFHPPTAVIADIDVLSSLPAREYRAGLAEVVKYGVACDAEFFDWCEGNVDGLNDRDPVILTQAVRRCVELKADVVASDPNEQGRRAILNFGHTFGHALEAVTNYQQYLHGEAVAIGMVAASHLSSVVGAWDGQRTGRVAKLLQGLGLPVAFPGNLSQDDLLDAMAMDKKVADGKLRFIVVDEMGAARVINSVTKDQIRHSMHSAAQEER